MVKLALADINKEDPEGMYQAVLSTPESFRSFLKSPGFSPPPFTQLLVSGMGGSAIAGDIITDTLEAYGTPVRASVYRRSDMPKWVDDRTLVLASSYSGNTREVRILSEQARKKGFMPVVMSSGGALADWAKEHTLPMIHLPSGLQPRAATPQAVAALLSFIISAHDMPLLNQWAEETAEDLAKLAPKLAVDSENNPALDLAEKIGARMPVFYAENHLASAARRAACQFNENSKLLSFYGMMPEMEHNEIVGWANKCVDAVPVLLRSSIDEQDMEILACEFDEYCGHLDIPAVGRNPLSEAMCAIFIADMASVYSAVIRNIDPTPVEPIMRIKRVCQYPASGV